MEEDWLMIFQNIKSGVAGNIILFDVQLISSKY